MRSGSNNENADNIKSHINEDEEDFCSRGLEYFRSEKWMYIQNNRKRNVISAVLGEQKRLQSEGQNGFNTEALASKSLVASKWARDSAVDIASSDAKEAAKQYAMSEPISSRSIAS